MAEDTRNNINRSDTTNFGNSSAGNNDANQENRRLAGMRLEDTEQTPINRIRQMAFPYRFLWP